MKKTVAYIFDPPIDIKLFESLCDEIFVHHDLTMTSFDSGYLLLDDMQINQLKTLQSFLYANGTALTAVIGYAINPVLQEALKLATKIARFQISHCADLMLLETMSGNDDLFQRFQREMLKVSNENLNTAKAFIESGCNAHLTSEALYIHRNTFAYRLNKFIDQTQLDIRDFHFARMFQIWMILNSMKR